MFEEENILETNTDLERITPLKPHRYPAWVWVLQSIIISMLLYSLFTVPKYLVVAKKIKDAQAAFDNKNYLEAFMLYNEVIDVAPQSNRVKLGLALACFALQNINDQLNEEDEFWAFIALQQLSGIKIIDNNDWEKLQKVMPQRYTQYFEEKDKK